MSSAPSDPGLPMRPVKTKNSAVRPAPLQSWSCDQQVGDVAVVERDGQLLVVRVVGDAVEHIVEAVDADPVVGFAGLERPAGRADPVKIQNPQFLRDRGHSQPGCFARKSGPGFKGVTALRSPARCTDPRQDLAASPTAIPNLNSDVGQNAMVAPVVAYPVGCQQREEPRIAAAFTTCMHDVRPWIVDDVEACLAHSALIVHLLAVEKERFVPFAHCVSRPR